MHPDVPAKSVGEWIKCVKAQPKPPSYGTAGPGSPQHLSMELLKSLTGTKLTHVPYRGDAPALNDLVAGHIPTQFAQPTPVLPLLRGRQGARARGFVDDAVRPDAGHPDHRGGGRSRLRLRRRGR